MPGFTRLDCGDSVCVLAGLGVIFFRMGLVDGFLSWSCDRSCKGGVFRV